MARYSDLVEQSVELTDDSGNLLRQIAGVHYYKACQRPPDSQELMRRGVKCREFLARNVSGRRCVVAAAARGVNEREAEKGCPKVA